MEGLNLLTCILETNRLTGLNFLDWFRNLKIVLSVEKIDVLFYTPPIDIPERVTGEERETWENLRYHELRVHNYILASMSNNLQRQHENFLSTANMIQNLKDLYGKCS